MIVARGVDGRAVTYDIAENAHENHILKFSRVPAGISAATADAEPIVKENPTGTEPPAPRTEPDRI